MKCANCDSEINSFPTYPEMFSDYAGWCMPCISQDVRLRYKYLESKGAFMKLRDLMNERDGGKISISEFENQKKQLFTI